MGSTIVTVASLALYLNLSPRLVKAETAKARVQPMWNTPGGGRVMKNIQSNDCFGAYEVAAAAVRPAFPRLGAH
jgi:hypothetical protein